MRNILLALFIIILFTSCGREEPVLKSNEYTITDTTYVSQNGFNQTLSYDVILLNHYDSMYHAGSITTDGRLMEYNAKPIKIKL
jgi:hypothetical protein